MVSPVGNNSNRIAKFITNMTKADAIAPVIALEATVVAGRTYQAYKRGKWDEARERCIEESMGSITWLGGVASLNYLGDKLVAQILKSNGKNFDVGTDKILRTPFDNFMKKVAPNKFTPTQIAALKATKVMTSIVLANLFIGFVVPKVNQALTHKLRHDRKEVEKTQTNQSTSFKGGMNAVNAFTNIIENTNTGKLLSSDIGIAGGRMYNARSKEERREIAIRDLGSIYFYMWAAGHVGNILNYLESGSPTRLNPSTAGILNEHLSQFLENNGNSMNVNDFRKAVLGKQASEIKLPKGLIFETEELSAMSKLFNNKPLEVIRLSEVEKVVTDKELLERLREMSKLQPQRCGESVLTKQQLIDAINKSEINNPKLLAKAFDEYTNGAYIDEYRYVSNKKLYKLKSEMEKYVETICKTSKNGKVDKKLLENVKKKNLTYNGFNFAAGFVVAASFLSTFIPKIQYWVTRKATGVDAFPGVYDFENHKERDD